MSAKLATMHSEVNNEVQMDQFGGGDKGVMLQLTQKSTTSDHMFDTVNMTRDQAQKLARELNIWLLNT